MAFTKCAGYRKRYPTDEVTYTQNVLCNAGIENDTQLGWWQGKERLQRTPTLAGIENDTQQ